MGVVEGGEGAGGIVIPAEEGVAQLVLEHASDSDAVIVKEGSLQLEGGERWMMADEGSFHGQARLIEAALGGQVVEGTFGVKVDQIQIHLGAVEQLIHQRNAPQVDCDAEGRDALRIAVEVVIGEEGGAQDYPCQEGIIAEAGPVQGGVSVPVETVDVCAESQEYFDAVDEAGAHGGDERGLGGGTIGMSAGAEQQADHRARA